MHAYIHIYIYIHTYVQVLEPRASPTIASAAGWSRSTAHRCKIRRNLSTRDPRLGVHHRQSVQQRRHFGNGDEHLRSFGLLHDCTNRSFLLVPIFESRPCRSHDGADGMLPRREISAGTLDAPPLALHHRSLCRVHCEKVFKTPRLEPNLAQGKKKTQE